MPHNLLIYAVYLFEFLFFLGIVWLYSKMHIGTKQKRIVLGFLALIASSLTIYLVQTYPPPNGVGEYPLYGTRTIFWIAIAVLLSNTLHYFVWYGLYASDEQKTQVKVYVIQFIDAVIYIPIAVVILTTVYEQSLTGLLVTSGVLAIVLGLSAQTTLGGVFSGLALNLNSSFKKGDYIISGDVRGRVVDMNWHSVTIKHRHENYIIVPNKKIDDSILYNCTMDNGYRVFEAAFEVQYEASPDLVKRILVRCGGHAEAVLEDPAPYAYIDAFGKQGIVYKLCVYTREFEDMQLSDQIYSSAWYALRRAGIHFIPTSSRYQITEPNIRETRHLVPTSIPDIKDMLRESYIFCTFGEEELDKIIQSARHIQTGYPERLVAEGDEGDSLYLVLQGNFGVEKDLNGKSVLVATLRQGNIFGEMSFLTGKKRSATVRSIKQGEVLEFSKRNMQGIFNNINGVMDRLAYIKAERETALDGLSPNEQAEAVQDYAKKLKVLINDFWRL